MYVHLLRHTCLGTPRVAIAALRLGVSAPHAHVRVQVQSPSAVAATNRVLTVLKIVPRVDGLNTFETFTNILQISHGR